MSPPPDGGILGPDGQPLRSRVAPTDHAGHEHEHDDAHDHDGGHEHGHEGHEHGLPEPSLTVHVYHLAGQVAMALGEVENPLSGQRETDLHAARFLIDVIAMLEEKTRGNRTPDEDEYLGGVLSNLRMAYVARSH